MKKTLKPMAVYVGMVIGAGFASGREVLEYFNFRTNTNISGVLLASFLFMIVAYLIMEKAVREKICTFDQYIASVAGRLYSFVKGFMLLYMFCGLFVMFAGSGALVNDVTVFSEFEGAILMAIICFVVLAFDVKGIVALNLVLVPLMIIGIMYVTVCTIIFGNTPTFASFSKGSGIMLSAVCYASYNTVTAGSVLVPLCNNITLKNVRWASVAGGFCIGLLIMIIWIVQGLNFDLIYQSDLPMLTLASLAGKTTKRAYTLVLFMAICTTAVSYGFGLMSHFKERIKTTRNRIIFVGVLCLVALPFSLYGFSNLVSSLYSIFGYIGMFWCIMVIVDRFR